MVESDFVEKNNEEDRRKGERRSGKDRRKISLLDGADRRVGGRRKEDSDRRSEECQKEED